MTLLNEADAVYLGDVAADAVYLGETKVWPPEVVGAGPASWLITSYTPGTDRNDFTGQVGVRLGIGGASIPFTWIGARSNGIGGTRAVKLYEWFTDSLVGSVIIDYTGLAAGEWTWVEVPETTLAANGYYALLMDVTAWDGQTWRNPGPVSMTGMANVYDCYRAGGTLGTGSPNSMFVGLDLGWGTATPPPEDFVPTDIAGLTVWLDASQLGLADGAYVDTWPSLVGSLVGANYNTVPNQPVMRTNALSGLPVVRFIVLSGLRWPNHGLDLQWTVIYVGRMWSTTIGRVVSGGYPPANIAFGFHGGLEDRVYLEGWLTAGQAQTTNWKLYRGWGDGVPGNAATGVYSNGVLLAGGANGQPGSQNGGGWKGTFHLNGYSPNSGEETCGCEIAEVLIYDHKLADAEYVQVEDYLRGKWGLA